MGKLLLIIQRQDVGMPPCIPNEQIQIPCCKSLLILIQICPGVNLLAFVTSRKQNIHTLALICKRIFFSVTDCRLSLLRNSLQDLNSMSKLFSYHLFPVFSKLINTFYVLKVNTSNLKIKQHCATPNNVNANKILFDKAYLKI